MAPTPEWHMFSTGAGKSIWQNTTERVQLLFHSYNTHTHTLVSRTKNTDHSKQNYEAQF